MAVETEGSDHTIELPTEQTRLIEMVSAANSRTIVVVKSRSAVLMPWLDKSRRGPVGFEYAPALYADIYLSRSDFQTVDQTLHLPFNKTGDGAWASPLPRFSNALRCMLGRDLLDSRLLQARDGPA